MRARPAPPTYPEAGPPSTASTNGHAPRGYRLLDMQLDSNVPGPLRGQGVTITAYAAGNVMVGAPQAATTDAQGRATVELGAAAATVVRIDVRDGLGNSGAATL